MALSGWSGSNYARVLDATHPTAFSLAALVKPANTSAQTVIWRTDSGEGANFSHEIRVNASGNWEAYVFTGAVQKSEGAAATTGWQLIVGTFADSQEIQIFVDGTGSTPTSVGGFWTGGDRWVAGKGNSQFASFSGPIAWAGMWPFVLSARQIAQLRGYRGRHLPGWRWLLECVRDPVVHTSLTAETFGALTPQREPAIIG